MMTCLGISVSCRCHLNSGCLAGPARADTLDAILSRYSITLQDARQMLDYSVGHSLHEFAAQYLGCMTERLTAT